MLSSEAFFFTVISSKAFFSTVISSEAKRSREISLNIDGIYKNDMIFSFSISITDITLNNNTPHHQGRFPIFITIFYDADSVSNL